MGLEDLTVRKTIDEVDDRIREFIREMYENKDAIKISVNGNKISLSYLQAYDKGGYRVVVYPGTHLYDRNKTLFHRAYGI